MSTTPTPTPQPSCACQATRLCDWHQGYKTGWETGYAEGCAAALVIGGRTDKETPS